MCVRIRNTSIAHDRDNITAKVEKERTKILCRRCMRRAIMKEIMATANSGIHPQIPLYPAPFHIPSLENISWADSNGEPDMIMATVAKIRARVL